MDVELIDLSQFSSPKLFKSQGACGTIYLAEQKGTKKKVIIKILKGSFSTDSDVQRDFIREVQIFASSKHPAIIGFLGYSFQDFDKNFYPCIVLEYAPKGSLGDIISNPEIKLSNTQKMIIIYGIAKGMEYLHSKNVIHRDFKPDNVLLDEEFRPLITDFGHSKIIIDDSIEMTTGRGTVVTNAPEAIMESNYNNKIDVYSFGMTLYWFMTGIRPYAEEKTMFKISSKITKGERPTFPENCHIDANFIDLIKSCWDHSPDARPTFTRIVEMFDQGLILPEVDMDLYRTYQQRFPRSKASKSYNELYIPRPNIQVFRAMEDSEYLNGLMREEKGERDIKISYIPNAINALPRFCQELSILKEIQHPCLLNFLGYSSASVSDPTDLIIYEKPKIDISLHQLIRDRTLISNWDGSKKSCCVFAIASLLSYLHKRNIIHGDIKPRNVFFNEHSHPLLGGFSSSRLIGHDSYRGIGSPLYMAPELFIADSRIPDDKIDIFAFGITLIEMIQGRVEFDRQPANMEELAQFIVEGKRPLYPKANEAFSLLIRQCLDEIPSMRPTANEIVTRMINNKDLVFKDTNLKKYFSYQQKLMKYDE